MRVLLAVVSGIAMGVLALGPIAHIRAQQSRAARTAPPPTPAAPIVETVPADAQPAAAEPAVHLADEFVTPRIVRSPAPPQQPAPRQRVEPRRKRPAPHRSLLARLFLGNGSNHPKPFPRPRS